MSLIIWTFIPSFFISLVVTGLLYLFLKRIKAGQVEREEGPENHKIKAGTPTMGGLAFISVAAAMACVFVDTGYLPVILLFLGYSAVGLFDDLVKIFNRRSLGLTFWQKIIIQTIMAAAFAYYTGGAWYYLLFLVFIIVGCGNAANLTDGLDGLLTGTAFLAFLSFSLVAYLNGFLGGAAFALIFAGSLLGFLPYNFPRAKLFMGDTGSLGAGAALAGLSVMLGKELLLALIGGLFLAEALSVIIQVGSYKLFRKRVFKMAPLHHHFELSGLSETKVVLMFWAVQTFLSAAGVMIR